MTDKTGKSKNPAHPNAHPTAPGGMSQKQLIAELITKHGFDPANAKALSWPQLISVVCQGRLDRDAEARATRSTEPDIFAEFDDAADVRSAVEREAMSSAPPPLFIGMPDTLDYRFDNHSGAGPSGAERWMHCTASLGASREFLETLSKNQQVQFSRANDAARQGTTAHSAAETEAMLMLGRIDQAEADYALLELAIIPETDGEAFDDEMAAYITEYTDLIKSYADERGEANVLIEARVEAGVPLTDLHEGEVHYIAGSGDCIVMPATKGRPEDKTLVVADLKYGDGINVDVDENPQVRIYGLGALSLLIDPDTGEWLTEVDTIVYHIVQPRLGGIKTWTESVDDLLAWRDDVLAPRLTKALFGLNEGATFEPSLGACQWCPARGGCAALAEDRLSQGADLFDTIVEAEFADGPGSFPETTSLTDIRLGELLSQVAGLIDIHKDLKEEAQRRLHRGNAIPGYQLVSYTPPRTWASTAADDLGDNKEYWTPPKLVTPTQALALFPGKGKEKEKLAQDSIGHLIVSPDRRPVIAREGDRRKTWTGAPPEQMFPDDVSGETGD